MNNITNNSTDYSLGIQSNTHYDPYGQWVAMSEYIKNYVLANPLLSPESIRKLLEFNAQYLVKIADYSEFEIVFGQRDVSPLLKEACSYQRDYREDNKLLIRSLQPLTDCFADQTYIHLVSSIGYKLFLKNIYNLLTIRWNDEQEVIETKIDKQLDQIKNTSQKQYYLYVLCEFEEFNNENLLKINSLTTFVNQKINERLDVWQKQFQRTIHLAKPFFGVTFAYAQNRQLLFNRSGEFLYTLARGGSTPTLQQSAEAMVRFNHASFEKFYTNLSCDKSVKTRYADFSELSFNFSTKPIPLNFSLDSRMNLILQKLESFQEKPHKKYHKILTQGLSSLLKGLLEINLEERFQSLHMRDSLAHCLERMDLFLEPLLKATNIISFGNAFDLIIEEISFLLRVTTPYQDGDFEKSLEIVVQPWLKPTYCRMTSSATQSFVEIVDHLRKNSAKEEANILYFDDLYFENVEFLDKLLYKPNIFTHKVNTEDNNLNHLLQKFQSNGKKVTSIFVDIHSSTQINRTKQLKHDLGALIQKLQNADVLAKTATFCIDYTIGMWGSEEVEKVLKDFEKDIQDGSIQIILYRSAHKLDIFGSDKFNSGNYLAYCRKDSPLYQTLIKQSPAILPSEIEYQIYTHFYKYATNEIQSFFNKMISNTSLLYQQLDPKYIYQEGAIVKNPFWITKKLDEKSTYLEISLKPKTEFFDPLCDQLEEAHLLNLRDSFGYREISLLRVGMTKDEYSIRITGGIDTKQNVLRYAQIINQFMDTFVIRSEKNNLVFIKN